MTRGLFIGLATLDVIHHVEAAPGPDAKVTASWQLLAAGGPALNAAVVFAALGGEATLLSRVGQGPVADLIRADLQVCGVDLVDAAGADATPSVSSIVVEIGSGTRRVVGLDAIASPAADGTAHGLDGFASETTRPDVLLIDGHHPDLARDGLDLAERLEVPRVLDAGRWKEPMTGLVTRCTDVIASAEFRLHGLLGGDDLLPAILGTGAHFAAVTAGGDDIRWQTTSTQGLVRPPAVEVVDTLGAGDALHGAYAWALGTDGLGAEDLGAGRAVETRVAGLRLAAAVASLSCTASGTRSWLPAARSVAGQHR